MFAEERLQRIEAGIVEIKELLQQLLIGAAVHAEHDDPTYLNVKQAAKLLGLEPSAIYSKCQQGILPHAKMGKYYKFKKEELLKWMQHSHSKGVDLDEYVNGYLQKNILKG